MDILLASLIMVWGNVSGAHQDVSFEKMVQASLDYKTTVEQQQQLAAANAAKGNGKGDTKADPGVQPASTFVPDPELINKQDPQNGAPKVKGIYSTAYSMAGSRLPILLKLLDETELNSLVIDIKDDRGMITYHTGNADLEAMGTTEKIIPDMAQLMSTLKAHDVYPIARIVVFKDTVLAKKKPEYSYLEPNGAVWQNPKHDSFVNPYLKEVWDYNIEVAKEAVKAGFKEIQFDYVRFPEGFEKKAANLKYTKDSRTRAQAVAGFVKYARQQLDPLGVRVSVDIFGYAASDSEAARGIGQDFQQISEHVDVISPMVYPSHYSTGWFKTKVPDAAPYTVIKGAMFDTNKSIAPLNKLKPIIRPWIQDFTASWVPGHIVYGKKEVEDQIRALNESGVDEYLLWNAGNSYSPGVIYK